MVSMIWEKVRTGGGVKGDSPCLMTLATNHSTAELHAMVLSSVCQSGGSRRRLYPSTAFLMMLWTMVMTSV